MEFLDVVSENDEVVGRASKEDIYGKCLPHRIVHVLVFNRRGEMLLQFRSKMKSGYPGYWAPAAGGHVQSGENCEKAALRELEEEIGITSDLKFLRKDNFNGRVFTTNLPILKIISFFTAEHNGPFRAEPKEVERLEFFSLGQIRAMIGAGEKFHPELLFLLKKHFGF